MDFVRYSTLVVSWGSIYLSGTKVYHPLHNLQHRMPLHNCLTRFGLNCYFQITCCRLHPKSIVHLTTTDFVPIDDHLDQMHLPNFSFHPLLPDRLSHFHILWYSSMIGLSKQRQLFDQNCCSTIHGYLGHFDLTWSSFRCMRCFLKIFQIFQHGFHQNFAIVHLYHRHQDMLYPY